MPNDSENLVRILTCGETPRVWSLVITIFGDLAQNSGDELSGGLLAVLTQPVGVKPEALRVALHRLRKEGWIASRRIGRNRMYHFTEWGRAQAEAASERIYSFEENSDPAFLSIFPPGAGKKQSLDTEKAWIASNIEISTMRTDLDAFTTVLTPERKIPEWMRAKVCDPALVDQCALVTRQFNELRSTLKSEGHPISLLQTILRVLVVHNWRRIALRMPHLPDHVFPADWTGPECRKLAGELLQLLPAPKLEQLTITAKAEPLA